MEPGRIRHTVSFTLVHPEGSEDERDFLDAARRLEAIADNAHPDQVRFVEERWLEEVADFLEIDYAPLG